MGRPRARRASSSTRRATSATPARSPTATAWSSRSPGDPTAYYPPGYPWFLGIVTWVSAPFTDEPWLAAGLVQAVLGAASVVLVASVAKRLAGPVAALVAALALRAVPQPDLPHGALLGETLYNFLFLAFLAVLFARPWTTDLSGGRILGAGVLLGLAVMVRPISLAVIPVLVLGWLLARKDYRITARWAGAPPGGRRGLHRAVDRPQRGPPRRVRPDLHQHRRQPLHRPRRRRHGCLHAAGGLRGAVPLPRRAVRRS